MSEVRLRRPGLRWFDRASEGALVWRGYDTVADVEELWRAWGDVWLTTPPSR